MCGLFAFAPNSWSQAGKCEATLCGTVLEAETGEPMAYAEVFIAETATGAITDENGRFHIHELCSGPYTVSCQHIGCTTVAKEVLIQGNVEVDFVLQHRVTALDEIVIREKAIAAASTQSVQSLQGLALSNVQGKTLSDASLSRAVQEDEDEMLEYLEIIIR